MVLKYVLTKKVIMYYYLYKYFIHRKEKSSNEKIICKCNDYKKINFRGFVHTIDDITDSVMNTLIQDIIKIKRKEFLNKIKETHKKTLSCENCLD